MRRSLRLGTAWGVVLALALCASQGSAASTITVDRVSFLPLAAPAAVPDEPEATDAARPVPLALGLRYAVASDYVWRGINLSEYPREGQEKVNHQLGSYLEAHTPIGNVGGRVWFEWFIGQEELTPRSAKYLQEIDYTVFWSYCVEPIGTTVELGWTAYQFPRQRGDLYDTYEVYGKLSLDDSVIFGIPLVSPFAYWAFDYDLGEKGSWIQVGGRHDLALADLGSPFKSLTFIKDLTLTPSVAADFDHRYLDKFAVAGSGSESRKLASIEYSLAVTYDVTSAVGARERPGKLTVGGFINWSQAVRRDLLKDELYGGAALEYSW